VAELRDQKRRKLVIVFAVLAVIDIGLGVVLLSPLVGSEQSRKTELDQLWKQLQVKTRQVEPLRGIDQKIVLAQQQIDDFYKNRLPSQDFAISEELGKLATDNGVRIGQVKYLPKDLQPVGVRPVFVEADFTGDYVQLVRFINALERDKVFFIVDSVDLGGAQGGLVKLSLKLEAYLKAST
jgi:type IV pilus assembly protein PilO